MFTRLVSLMIHRIKILCPACRLIQESQKVNTINEPQSTVSKLNKQQAKFKGLQEYSSSDK